MKRRLSMSSRLTERRSIRWQAKTTTDPSTSLSLLPHAQWIPLGIVSTSSLIP